MEQYDQSRDPIDGPGGDVADYMYSQPQCRNLTYGKLCSLLEKRFGVAQSLTSDKKKLRERKKQKGETYRYMGQEILRLASRVYQGAPSLAEEESKEQFIRALPENMWGRCGCIQPQDHGRVCGKCNPIMCNSGHG